MIELRINEIRFLSSFDTSLSRSLDNLSGQMSFSTSSLKEEIKVGNRAEIFIGRKKMFTGWVENLEINNSGDELSRTFEGRENVADFLDSSLPDSVKVFQAGLTPETLLRKVLDALLLTDIKVINKAGKIEPFKWIERVAGESGTDAFGFIADYMRKRGIFMNSDGEGNIVLFKLSGEIPASFSFENSKSGRTNILSSSGRLDFSSRFRKYICKSQAQATDDFGDSVNFNRFGKAEDSEVRASRYFEFMSEESMTTAECKQRAEEEANIRRARSLEYTVTVPNFEQEGEIYDIGKVARVNDEIVGIKGDLLIRSITFREAEGEKTTEITMTYPDAYSLEAQISQKAQRRIDMNRFLSERDKGTGEIF